jgi:cytochrome c2
MDKASSHISGKKNPEVSHEHTDVSVRGILLFGAGLIILAVVTHLLLWWVFDYFSVRDQKQTQPRVPSIARPQKELPPEPRLQVSPAKDMREMRASEDAILHSYGWVDQKTNTVRIPIEQAMKLIAEKGLPVRSRDGVKSEDTPAQGFVAYELVEGSSSGRTIRGEPYRVPLRLAGSETQQVVAPTTEKLGPAGETSSKSLASEGEKLFQESGCNVCHKIGARGRGPDLAGIFGKPVQLQNGETVIADEAYIRESILHPAAKIVAGFPPIMLPYEGKLSEEDVTKLVEYIKSLGSKEK